MNPIGPRGRAHLELNVELTAQAIEEGWYYLCELKPVLVAHGLAGANCSTELTFCHTTKHYGGNYELAHEVCRGCTFHHYPMDELAPRLVTRLVREVVARRYMEPDDQLSLSLIELDSCSTCVFRLTKSPSHDPLFDRHLRHATLADLRTALGRTIEMKTSRRLILGKIRQLEREAQWKREDR